MTSARNPRVRVAAIADLHLRVTASGPFNALDGLDDVADLLVVAGDITETGRIAEVELAADLLQDLPIPVFAVLGNHDRRGLRRMAMRKTLARAGVHLLDGEHHILDMEDGTRVGIAGVTGTGGGFGPGRGGNGPGGRITRAVTLKARRETDRLDAVLADMESSEPAISLLVTHFAPSISTLGTEPPLKYWMLGNAGLGKVIDDHHIDLAIHGHAHLGNEVGVTPGGTPVRNVAAPIVGRVMVYHVEPGRRVTSAAAPSSDEVAAAISSGDVPGTSLERFPS